MCKGCLLAVSAFLDQFASHLAWPSHQGFLVSLTWSLYLGMLLHAAMGFPVTRLWHVWTTPPPPRPSSRPISNLSLRFVEDERPGNRSCMGSAAARPMAAGGSVKLHGRTSS